MREQSCIARTALSHTRRASMYATTPSGWLAFARRYVGPSCYSTYVVSARRERSRSCRCVLGACFRGVENRAPARLFAILWIGDANSPYGIANMPFWEVCLCTSRVLQQPHNIGQHTRSHMHLVMAYSLFVTLGSIRLEQCHTLAFGL